MKQDFNNPITPVDLAKYAIASDEQFRKKNFGGLSEEALNVDPFVRGLDDFNKYDVNLTVGASQNFNRSKQQDGWGKGFRAIARLPRDFAAEAVSTVGSLFAIPDVLTGTYDRESMNPFAKGLLDLADTMKSDDGRLVSLYTNETGVFEPFDSNWWAKSITGFAPTIGMMVGSMGTGLVLKGAAKGTTSLITSGLKRTTNALAKKRLQAKATLIANKAGGLSATSRLAQKQIYDQVYNQGLSKIARKRLVDLAKQAKRAANGPSALAKEINGISDVLLFAGIQRNAETLIGAEDMFNKAFEFYKQQDPTMSEDAIRAKAGEQASKVYKKGMSLIALDIIQYANILGKFGLLSGGTTKEAIGNLLISSASESLEEGLQNVFSTQVEEAMKYGTQEKGIIDTFIDQLEDKEMQESLVQGFIGGLVFEGLGSMYSRKLKKTKDTTQAIANQEAAKDEIINGKPKPPVTPPNTPTSTAISNTTTDSKEEANPYETEIDPELGPGTSLEDLDMTEEDFANIPTEEVESFEEKLNIPSLEEQEILNRLDEEAVNDFNQKQQEEQRLLQEQFPFDNPTEQESKAEETIKKEEPKAQETKAPEIGPVKNVIEEAVQLARTQAEEIFNDETFDTLYESLPDEMKAQFDAINRNSVEDVYASLLFQRFTKASEQLKAVKGMIGQDADKKVAAVFKTLINKLPISKEEKARLIAPYNKLLEENAYTENNIQGFQQLADPIYDLLLLQQVEKNRYEPSPDDSFIGVLETKTSEKLADYFAEIPEDQVESRELILDILKDRAKVEYDAFSAKYKSKKPNAKTNEILEAFKKDSSYQNAKLYDRLTNKTPLSEQVKNLFSDVLENNVFSDIVNTVLNLAGKNITFAFDNSKTKIKYNPVTNVVTISNNFFKAKDLDTKPKELKSEILKAIVNELLKSKNINNNEFSKGAKQRLDEIHQFLFEQGKAPKTFSAFVNRLMTNEDYVQFIADVELPSNYNLKGNIIERLWSLIMSYVTGKPVLSEIIGNLITIIDDTKALSKTEEEYINNVVDEKIKNGKITAVVSPYKRFTSIFDKDGKLISLKSNRQEYINEIMYDKETKKHYIVINNTVAILQKGFDKKPNGFMSKEGLLLSETGEFITANNTYGVNLEARKKGIPKDARLYFRIPDANAGVYSVVQLVYNNEVVGILSGVFSDKSNVNTVHNEKLLELRTQLFKKAKNNEPLGYTIVRYVNNERFIKTNTKVSFTDISPNPVVGLLINDAESDTGARMITFSDGTTMSLEYDMLNQTFNQDGGTVFLQITNSQGEIRHAVGDTKRLAESPKHQLEFIKELSKSTQDTFKKVLHSFVRWYENKKYYPDASFKVMKMYSNTRAKQSSLKPGEVLIIPNIAYHDFANKADSKLVWSDLKQDTDYTVIQVKEVNNSGIVYEKLDSNYEPTGEVKNAEWTKNKNQENVVNFFYHPAQRYLNDPSLNLLNRFLQIDRSRLTEPGYLDLIKDRVEFDVNAANPLSDPDYKIDIDEYSETTKTNAEQPAATNKAPIIGEVSTQSTEAKKAEIERRIKGEDDKSKYPGIQELVNIYTGGVLFFNINASGFEIAESLKINNVSADDIFNIRNTIGGKIGDWFRKGFEELTGKTYKEYEAEIKALEETTNDLPESNKTLEEILAEPDAQPKTTDNSALKEINDWLDLDDVIPSREPRENQGIITLQGNEELYKEFNLLNNKGEIKTVPYNDKTKAWVKSLNKSNRYSFTLRQTPSGYKIFIINNKNRNDYRADETIQERLFKDKNRISTKEMLAIIAKGNHSLNKLAKKLQEFVNINNASIELVTREELAKLNPNSDKKDLGYNGAYYELGNVIYIVKDGLFKKGQAESTVLHEILHAFTYNELRTNKKLRADFEKLYNSALEQLDLQYQLGESKNPINYGLTNLDEFIVALFTDSVLITKLQELNPLDGKKYKNLFEEIFDYILKLLKIDKRYSLYDEAFSLATNIINEAKLRQEEALFYQENSFDLIEEPPFFDDSVSNQTTNNLQVQYTLKAISILNSDKAKQVFAKGKKANWSLDKTLTELQIPKEQKQLILDLGITDREQLALELANQFSFVVEVNTAKGLGDTFSLNNKYYLVSFEDEISYYADIEGDELITENVLKYRILNPNGAEAFEFKNKIDAEKKLEELNSNLPNSNIYVHLTVPGGTNYTENEISAPLITPSIKGHAQFSTDNGIGWFRSDEKVIKDNTELDIEGLTASQIQDLRKLGQIDSEVDSKTRRILEVQSDLFQKGRDKEDLINKTDKSKLIGFLKNEEKYLQQLNNELEEIKRLKEDDLIEGKLSDIKQQEKIVKINKQNIDNFEKFKQLPDNQFLQLLNKNNNWVTFFIKSIIQDSAKKGYEKVLFPSGNTASKVEGHTTLEQFKKQKKDRIKELESRLTFQNNNLKESIYFNKEYYSGKFNYIPKVTKEQIEKFTGVSSSIYTKEFLENDIDNINNEINQLKAELQRVETEGFGALKPIYNFYENTVTNILNKTYGKENVKLITDEYGNTWNEIRITNKSFDTILFDKAPNQNNTQPLDHQFIPMDEETKVVFKENGKEVGHIFYEDVGGAINIIKVESYEKRKGYATRMYQTLETITGMPILEGKTLTEEGKAFRDNYVSIFEINDFLDGTMYNSKTEFNKAKLRGEILPLDKNC